jgi:isopropylmalate/homocitrate/citramalate synthase
MKVPRRVTVVEVGPRDGLQNEDVTLTVDDRALFCERLLEAGLRVVEVGAFVSPERVPQMAGSDEVFQRVARRPDARLPVLVPNRRGFERARACDVREIAVFTAASETFNRKNINASIDESFKRFAEFVPDAHKEGMWVRGYVSTCFGCPYEGAVDPATVVEVARRLTEETGCHEVSIGDTIGVAVPTQVADLIGRLRGAVPVEQVAVHFHDTRGTALANVLAALQEGVTTVDSSAGGIGGCPYAPGASGNLATEDLLYMLHGMGIETGVDLKKVVTASRALEARLGHALPSRYLQATARV